MGFGFNGKAIFHSFFSPIFSVNSFHSFPFFRSIWKVYVPSKVQVLSGLWVFGKMRISYVMCYKDASHTYTPFPQTSMFMNLFEDLGCVMFSVQVFFTLVHGIKC